MAKTQNVRKRVYLFLLAVAVLAISAHFLSPYLTSDGGAAQANSDGLKKAEENLVPVELAVATSGEISSFLTATANLRPVRQVESLAQTDGIAQQVSVEEGDHVRAGQVLCTLDDSQLQIQLLSAQQKLAQARLQSEKAQIRHEKAQTQIANSREDLARYQQLFEQKLVSEREVSQLRYRLDELTHDERASSFETRELTHRVKELEAEIDQVELQLSLTQVVAPFSGIITERMVVEGQTLRKLDKLFKLADFSPLLAEVYVSEREARKLQPGQQVVVRLDSAESSRTTGKVLRLSPIVDQATGTVKITVELSGARSSFKPGAFVNVEIETDSRSDVVLIPKRAVQEKDGKHYVFVNDDQVAREVQVELGYEHSGQVEVRQGISPGQKVVIAGQGALKEGSRLKTVSG